MRYGMCAVAMGSDLANSVCIGDGLPSPMAGRHVPCYLLPNTAHHMVRRPSYEASHTRPDLLCYVNAISEPISPATRSAIQDDHPPRDNLRRNVDKMQIYSVRCCNCRPPMPHDKRKHEMQCHSRLAKVGPPAHIQTTDKGRKPG